MRYVVLLGEYVDPNRSWENLSEEEQGAELGRHEAFAEAVAAREGCELIGGEALTGGDSATVLRATPGAVTLTDGPFSESTELIGGLYIVEAPDLDVLVELLSIMSDYVMEIRPVVQY
ncbi:YciI family protein [Salana multivorans]